MKAPVVFQKEFCEALSHLSHDQYQCGKGPNWWVNARWYSEWLDTRAASIGGNSRPTTASQDARKAAGYENH